MQRASFLRARRLIVVCSMLLSGSFGALAQQEIVLWPGGAPGSEGKGGEEVVRLSDQGEHIVSRVHRPSITSFLAAQGHNTGAAVIVIPGGGHRELWMDHEGYNVARWLSERGVNAFVLKYRLAREKDSTYSVEGDALADVKRAIRLVRSRAREWGVDRKRVGVMGFSAGGELAVLAGTRYDRGATNTPDPIEGESSRPAFQALLYPAIPHDLKLSAETPPAFLVCGENDRPDIAQGLPELFLALKRAGASAELHVYAGVGHGFGFRPGSKPPVSEWLELFIEWLGGQEFLRQQG